MDASWTDSCAGSLIGFRTDWNADWFGLCRPVQQPGHFILVFVRSERYGKNWQGSLLLGSLKFDYLARLEIDGQRVVREEKLVQKIGQGIRDVREGPDGYIYLLTDAANGQLIRLLPE